MQRKLLLPIILSCTLVFLINLFTNQNLSISITNTLTLLLSIYFFRNYLIEKNFLIISFIIVSFGLIPLFYYLPSMYFISLLPLCSLLFIYIYKKIPNKYILISFALFLFLGNFFAGEVIKYPFSIQKSQLIFNSPEINYNLKRHQQDALFIPYRMRQIMYSGLIYPYPALTSFFDFLTLKNLSDVLLIANLYPLFVGFYLLFKQNNVVRKICLTAFLVTIFTTSIDRSPDKFQSLYLLSPILVYLIILGIQKINKILYFALWLLTIFIMINPKI